MGPLLIECRRLVQRKFVFLEPETDAGDQARVTHAFALCTMEIGSAAKHALVGNAHVGREAPVAQFVTQSQTGFHLAQAGANMA